MRRVQRENVLIYLLDKNDEALDVIRRRLLDD